METILPDAGARALTPAAIQEPVAASPVVAAVTAERKACSAARRLRLADNADSYLAHLRAQVDWLAPVLHVYRRMVCTACTPGRATQAEARTAADRISQSLGIETMVLVR